MTRASHHVEPQGTLQIARHYVRDLEAQHLPDEEASPVRHGLATFAAFVLAGVLPLAR